MNITGIVFCAFALVATFAVSWIVFPMAAMSHDELAAASTPVEAEMLGDVAIPDFGDIPVLDMVLHYIDNPPVESAAEAATNSGKVRFQGC